MNDESIRRSLGSLRALLLRGEGDPAARDDADRAFRAEYVRLRAGGEVPPPVAESLRRALLALVGDDEWTVARAYVERALDRLGREPAAS